MKKASTPFLGLLFSIFIFACKKDNSTTTTNNSSLDATKTSSISKGEPVVFSMAQAVSGDPVNWTVNPGEFAQINTSGSTASIMFGSKGNYTVTASSGATVQTSVVSVNDSVYTGGDIGNSPSSTLSLVSGELIKISVIRLDTNAVSGLAFVTQTTNSYTCLSNSLNSETTSDANGFTIKFTGVNVPGGCTGSEAKARGFNYLYPITNNSNKLTIVLNGTIYNGTITKTAGGFTIDWPNSTGVTISPNSL